jgi:hypothetical protein
VELEQNDGDEEIVADDEAVTTDESATSEPGEADAEAVETEESAEDSGDDAQPDRKPKDSGFQRRIRQLVAERNALQQQLQQYAQPQDEAKADPEPTRDQFETYEQYDRALARWEAKQVFRQEQETQRYQQAQHFEQQFEREVNNAWMEQRAHAASRYADFDNVVDAIGTQVTETMATGIKMAEDGADIAYYLGKHPREVERIRDMAPAQQLIEIGKLSAKARPQASASNAPRPVDRVKPKSAPVNALSDKAPVDAWMKARQKQVRSS